MTESAHPVPGIDPGIPGCVNPVEIGHGGFGVVYRAQQPEFNRTVAVKLLMAAGLDDAARMRFQREIAAMGSLSGHPNIVTVHQAGLNPEGRAYIVMAFEPGGSLGDRLSASGALPWQEAVAIAVKLAGALEAAHRAGILHRDVKPENVLISAYREPKLADFGIARLEGSAHTQSGLITASIAHAAPEILLGKPPSVASDVYALASTVYSLILGRPAFVLPTDESFLPVFHRISTQAMPDLRGDGVPAQVCSALERATAKAPEERQASAALFGAELQQAQQMAGVQVTPMVGDAGAARAVPQRVAPPLSPAPQETPTLVLPQPAAATAPRPDDVPTVAAMAPAAVAAGWQGMPGAGATPGHGQPQGPIPAPGNGQPHWPPPVRGNGQPQWPPPAPGNGQPQWAPYAPGNGMAPSGVAGSPRTEAKDPLMRGAALLAALGAAGMLAAGAMALRRASSYFRFWIYDSYNGPYSLLHVPGYVYVFAGAALVLAAAVRAGLRGASASAGTAALAVVGAVIAGVGIRTDRFLVSQVFLLTALLPVAAAVLVAVSRNRLAQARRR